jgi:hypothetical protein
LFIQAQIKFDRISASPARNLLGRDLYSSTLDKLKVKEPKSQHFSPGTTKFFDKKRDKQAKNQTIRFSRAAQRLQVFSPNKAKKHVYELPLAPSRHALSICPEAEGGPTAD